MFQKEKQGNISGCLAPTSPFLFPFPLLTHTDVPSTEEAVKPCVYTDVSLVNPPIVFFEWQSDSVVRKQLYSLIFKS